MTNTDQWAIYARVSTEDQGEKYGPASQKNGTQTKITQLGGGVVPAERIYEDHCTGSNTNRPAFQRLKADIEAGRINAVMIYSIDRLSRDVVDALVFTRWCESKNIRLEFVNFTMGNTAQDELMLTLTAAIGQLDRRQILDRCKRGRDQKVREGYLHCGSVPFGYRYRGKQQGSRGEMVIHDQEAGTVRLIFELYADGMTVYAIKVRLNEEGIRSARGGMWSRTTIHQTLTNSAYAGRAIFGKNTENPTIIPCPVIISDELFARVQLQLKKNRIAYSGRPSRNYLLTNLLWCDECGARCGSKVSNGRPCYRCGNIDQFLYRHKCGAREILRDKLETAVWDALWNALTNPDVLWNLARAYYVEMAKPDAETRNSLTRRMKRLEQQEARDLQILFDPRQQYDKASKHLEATRAELAIVRDELAQLRIIEMPTRADIEALCAEFAAGRNLESFADRRTILKMATRKIRWNSKKQEVIIEGAISFNRGMREGGSSPTEPAGVKNCHRRCGADDNSFASIPFILKRRVA